MAVAADVAYPFSDDSVGEAEWSEMASKCFAKDVPGVLTTLDLLEPYGDASGMVVKVKAGETWIAGKFARWNAVSTLSIGTAPGVGSERVDVVIVRVDFVNKRVELDVKAGTEKTVASGLAHANIASLTDNSTVKEVIIARVLVSASVPNIAAGKVIDCRPFGRSSSGWHPGDIREWPTSSDFPAGFLWADGTAISRFTYAELFEVCGTAFGAGDGSTTFNLPDYRGEVRAGLDNLGSGGAGRLTGMADVAAHYGEQKHVQTSAEMASHSHTPGTLATSTAGSHNHEVLTASGKQPIFSATYGTGVNNGWQMTTPGGSSPDRTMADFNGNHTHTFSGSTATTGSGTAANVVQPTHMVYVLIGARPT